MSPGPSVRLCWTALLTVCRRFACFRLFCWSLYFMQSGDSFPARLFPLLPFSSLRFRVLHFTLTCYYIVFIYIYYIRVRVSAYPPFCTCRGWAGVAGARAVPLFMYAGGFSRVWERWPASGLFWRPGPGLGLSELRRLSLAGLLSSLLLFSLLGLSWLAGCRRSGTGLICSEN